METAKERSNRKKRAEKQLAELGYVSLRNRKSPDQIRLAMEASSGNQRLVCQLLKCTNREFNVLLSQDNELAILWKEIRQSIVSEAEGVLVTLLNSKSENMRFQTARYILDRRGKELGYGQIGNQITVETNDKGGVSIKSIFGLPED